MDRANTGKVSQQCHNQQARRQPQAHFEQKLHHTCKLNLRAMPHKLMLLLDIISRAASGGGRKRHCQPWPAPYHSANMSENPSPVIVPPGAGRKLCAFGDEVVVHLGGAETGGKYTLFTDTTAPGGGPPPHYHTQEDETFYVLAGQVSYFANGRWQPPVGPGTVTFAPKGSRHAFKNTGTVPLVQLISTAPAGFETFFARCAAEFAAPGGPNMERILAIGAEHGIHFPQV